jgi:hypothetical protein
MRFYQGSSELDSWCESGCSSGASNTIFWVLVPAGLGSSSPSNQIQLNLTFLSVGTEYDGLYAGEAPQLSCSSYAFNALTNLNLCNANYAKYDNGASVFYQYDNFKGPTFAATWLLLGNSNKGDIANNGLSIVNGNTIIWNSGYNPQSYISDFYGYFTTYTSGSQFAVYPNNGRGGNPQLQVQAGNGCTSNAYTLFIWSSGSNCGPSLGALSITSPNVFSIWTTSTALFASANYASPVSETSAFSVVNPMYLTITSGGDQIVGSWFRERIYPPGGVMPVETIGTLSH